jgi:cell division protein FtsI (penicillin-binding protein 3)
MLRMDPRALKWMKVRLGILGAGLATGLVLLGARAYRLQVEESARLQTMARQQYTERLLLPAGRGPIVDRNGNALAITLSVDSVAADPKTIEDPTAVAGQLARVLGLDATDLQHRLSSDHDFTWIKRRVTPDEAKAVAALSLPGISLEPEPRRYYPERDAAGAVLGYVGADGNGLAGLELSQDHWLRGDTGITSGLRDANGHVMLTAMPDTAPTAGHTVVTTLDATIQSIAEQALADGVQAAQAKWGCLVAVDPATGDVLAMASYPGLNPNSPSASPDSRDLGVSEAYEPGSTMKVFSVSTALEAGVVQPTDVFDAQNGAMRVGNATIHDDEPHGLLTVSEVIQKSSNVGAAKIAARLGRKDLEAGLRLFGFGESTHLGLPAEAAGVLRPSSTWGSVALANIAFGQGMTATPVQLVSALSAIAEGGVYHPPHVIERITDDQGNVVWQPDLTPRTVLSAKTSTEMQEMLGLVLQQGGTAAGMSPDGYTAAGKTGTAQKVDPGTGHYSKDLWVSSFMGYAPADHPRIAMIVVVDEPQGTHLGGRVAAPVFKAVAEEALRYLGVPPEIEVPAAVASSAPGASTSPIALGAAPAPTPGVDGTPLLPLALDTVQPVDVVPALANDSVRVPDFTGMSIPQAMAAAEAAHVGLLIDGSGRAAEQSPAPGPAVDGTSCHVSFLPPG